jgi:hypothetical protein
MNKNTKQWILLLTAGIAPAILGGLLLGVWARSAGWGFCALAIAVGLVPGLAMLGFARAGASERLITAGVATLLGLLVFGWASHVPAWRAETAVAPEELDDLCVRITAMRHCGERKIMGVFDFADVPAHIVDESRQEVAEMPRETKLAMCNRTFGARMNQAVHAGPSAEAISKGVVWVVLAAAAATGPVIWKNKSTN